MRVEVRKTRALERRSEYLANWRGAGPTFPIKPGDFKMTARANGDARRRKERVVQTPKPFFLQESHPLGEDGENFVADRKEIGRERLGEFGPDQL